MRNWSKVHTATKVPEGMESFFGEGCLAGQPLRMASATAMTECSVVRVQRQQ
jgi:CRP-like cAMP-binding protein